MLAAVALVLLVAIQVEGEKTVTNVRIRNKYALPGGRVAYVMDDAVPQNLVLSLTTFMTTNDNWRYVLHDPHSVTKVRLYDDRNGIPWKSWKDPSLLKTTTVGNRIRNIVRTIDANARNSTKRNFELNEVYAALIRRGDRTKMVAEGERDEDSYTVVLFNNIVWRKNGYGELLLYDDDGEIMATIRPKFARTVVFHSSIKYIIRPPSIAQLTTQSVTIMHFGADAQSNLQKELHYVKLVQSIRRPPSLSSSISQYKNKPVEEKDIEKHLTLYRKNRKNHFVAVFDDLFDDDALSAIRAWTIKYGLYFFDGSLDVSSDNVQWIAAINIHDFVKTDFWPIIHKIAKFVSNSSSWYPYDVACNLIRSYDHTRFHLDTSDRHEKEMTFLLYLSPNWTALDYGETAFVETNNDHPYNEYNAEVVPTFGRAVIFDGNFPHSAHPPAVQHYNARYTLAVKLSYNKMIAVKKTFVEEKKHEPIMPSAVSNMAQLKQDPVYNVGMAKVRGVVEHLGLRNLQNMASGAEPDGPEPEGAEGEDGMEGDAGMEEEGKGMEREETEDKEEGDETQGANEDAAKIPFLEEFEEMDSPLTPKQTKMVTNMIKYHKLDKMSESPEEEIEDPFLQSFAEERREGLIANWQKVCTKDANALNDYLELYLRQRLWLKDYVMGKMTTLL